ncbi:MAG: hypothetical protein P8Y99_11045 [Calditrichaceae bacterium]
MSAPLIKELSESGLHSINIIFNSSSVYTETGWVTMENDEGQKLYTEMVDNLNYKVDEVHSSFGKKERRTRNGHQADTSFDRKIQLCPDYYQ